MSKYEETMEEYRKITEGILKTEYSAEFDNKRKNAMVMGFYKYGAVKDNTENGFIKAIESAEKAIDLYKKTGNKDYLISLGNYAMMEYMHPTHPEAHENSNDSVRSSTVKNTCMREIENLSKGIGKV